jgi:hypothetical protein
MVLPNTLFILFLLVFLEGLKKPLPGRLAFLKLYLQFHDKYFNPQKPLHGKNGVNNIGR